MKRLSTDFGKKSFPWQIDQIGIEFEVFHTLDLNSGDSVAFHVSNEKYPKLITYLQSVEASGLTLEQQEAKNDG